MNRRTFLAALFIAGVAPVRALFPQREMEIDMARFELVFEPLPLSVVDAALIEQSRLTREDVARVFNVPPQLIGGSTWDA